MSMSGDPPGQRSGWTLSQDRPTRYPTHNVRREFRLLQTGRAGGAKIDIRSTNYPSDGNSVPINCNRARTRPSRWPLVELAECGVQRIRRTCNVEDFQRTIPLTIRIAQTVLVSERWRSHDEAEEKGRRQSLSFASSRRTILSRRHVRSMEQLDCSNHHDLTRNNFWSQP